jgi:uncharacterized protein YdhG (YjbR/CyaY superfamily)
MKKIPSVDEYMEQLEHPLKAEVQEIRKIIMGVSPLITEEVKWNSPSFSYTDYLATFNLHVTKHVHLVFHNTRVMQIQSDLLEGKFKDRKMIFFTSMEDVLAKKTELERIVRELMALLDKYPPEPKVEGEFESKD